MEREKRNAMALLIFATLLMVPICIWIIPGLLFFVQRTNLISIGICGFYIFPVLAGWILYFQGKHKMAGTIVLTVILPLVLYFLYLLLEAIVPGFSMFANLSPLLCLFDGLLKIFAIFLFFNSQGKNKKGNEYVRNG